MITDEWICTLDFATQYHLARFLRMCSVHWWSHIFSRKILMLITAIFVFIRTQKLYGGVEHKCMGRLRWESSDRVILSSLTTRRLYLWDYFGMRLTRFTVWHYCVSSKSHIISALWNTYKHRVIDRLYLWEHPRTSATILGSIWIVTFWQRDWQGRTLDWPPRSTDSCGNSWKTV